MSSEPGWITSRSCTTAWTPPSSRAGASRLRERYGLRDHPVVLFLGGLKPRKNLAPAPRRLGRVVSRAPAPAWSSRGWSPPDPLRGRASRLGLDGHVVFTGYVPESEKADHFNLADVFVFPRRWRASASPSARPCRSDCPWSPRTAVPCRSSLVDGQGGFLCAPSRPDAFVEALLPLLARRRRCGKSSDGPTASAWTAASAGTAAWMRRAGASTSARDRGVAAPAGPAAVNALDRPAGARVDLGTAAASPSACGWCSSPGSGPTRSTPSTWWTALARLVPAVPLGHRRRPGRRLQQRRPPRARGEPLPLDLGVDYDLRQLPSPRAPAASAGRRNARLFAWDITRYLSLRRRAFDASLFLDVIEHLVPRVAVLREIHRLLTDDGRLLVSGRTARRGGGGPLRRAGLFAYSDPDHKIEYARGRIPGGAGRRGTSSQTAR